MSSQKIGFVGVVGAIEPKALAAPIARDAHNRLGELVVLTCDWLEEDGNPLSQRQKLALASNASSMFDGFEGAVLGEILEHVRRIRLGGADA